jgi:hypothetical protein
MAASLLGLGLLLGAGRAAAQGTVPPPSGPPVPALPSAPPALTFTKEAGARGPAGLPAPAPPTLTFTKEAGARGPAGQRVVMQVPPPPGGMRAPGTVIGEEQESYQIQLEPPGPDRLFRLESEDALHERMRQEARQRTPMARLTFPDEPIVSDRPYAGRSWAPSAEIVEPTYVCYGRLYFEQKNPERYGWDLSLLSPIVCATEFYFDFLTLPYNAGTEPFRKCECSAGYCLPGDPVPYLLYPPKLSLTGLLAEGAAYAGVRYLLLPQ